MSESVQLIQPTPPITKILLCTPVALGLPRVEYTVSLVGTVVALLNHGCQLLFSMEESGDIVRSRNFAAAQVLLDPTITHLMFLDADMSWREHDAMAHMLCKDRDVIAGAYTTRWHDARWTFRAGDVQNLRLTPDGLLPAQYVPTGFMLLKRQVLERIVAARPDLKCNFDSVRTRPDLPGQVYDEPGKYLIFDSRVSADGTYMSDDFGFCETWGGIGGEMFLYPNVTISHHWTTANTANLHDWLVQLGVATTAL